MLGVSILGAGFMGRTHAECYLKNSKCKLNYIFDKNIDRAKDLASYVGAKATDDINTVLSKDIDMIDICLPTYLHLHYVEMAAKAGKHILCEKPMAINIKECDEIIGITTNHNIKYMVAHVIRFWPEYRYMKKVIDSGELGEPIYATASRMQPMPLWSESNWIVNPSLSVGGVVDLQIHDLDFMSWVFGKPSKLKSVGSKSRQGGWEQVITIMEHEGGIQTCTEACNLMPVSYPFTARFKVLFTDGCIEYDCNAPKSLVVYRPGRQPENPVINDLNGYQNEIDYFTECILENRETILAPAGDARFALYLALKSKESLESNNDVVI